MSKTVMFDNRVCFMTGENTVSCFDQFVVKKFYVYLKTGQNWPTGSNLNLFPKDNIFNTLEASIGCT